MKDRYIFWSQKLSVAGRATIAGAEAKLRKELSARGFGLQARLAGRLEGSRLRVWRAGSFGYAADVVEFEGVLRPHAQGVVIEGTLRYRRATQFQFLGLLSMGLAFLAAGVARALAGAPAGTELLGLGAFVSAATLFWIYSSARMRHEQIRFIEEKLAQALAA
jgi:hypothetical protein